MNESFASVVIPLKRKLQDVYIDWAKKHPVRSHGLLLINPDDYMYLVSDNDFSILNVHNGYNPPLIMGCEVIQSRDIASGAFQIIEKYE